MTQRNKNAEPSFVFVPKVIWTSLNTGINLALLYHFWEERRSRIGDRGSSDHFAEYLRQSSNFSVHLIHRRKVAFTWRIFSDQNLNQVRIRIEQCLSWTNWSKVISSRSTRRTRSVENGSLIVASLSLVAQFKLIFFKVTASHAWWIR